MFDCLKVGGWTLFFSDEQVINIDLTKDTWIAENLFEIGDHLNCNVIISSYLDDLEWLVFIK